MAICLTCRLRARAVRQVTARIRHSHQKPADTTSGPATTPLSKLLRGRLGVHASSDSATPGRGGHQAEVPSNALMNEVAADPAVGSFSNVRHIEGMSRIESQRVMDKQQMLNGIRN